MTNEELKQEAIKKAYGEYYNDLRIVIEHTHGWCKQNLKKYFGEDNIQSKIKKESLVYRPISLSGIESNNGWIRIEEDGSNLPKEKTKCHFIIRGFEENEYLGYFEFNLFWNKDQAYSLKIVTHYQPIIKPKPPIY